MLPLATGFGNGLIAALFLGATLSLLGQRWKTAAVFSALMPLARPDGLVWSLLLAAAVALNAALDDSSDKRLGAKLTRVTLLVVPPRSLSSPTCRSRA